MSPEYAMQGRFSTRSDAFSFGVLLLEIVSGRSNNSFYQSDRLQDLSACVSNPFSCPNFLLDVLCILMIWVPWCLPASHFSIISGTELKESVLTTSETGSFVAKTWGTVERRSDSDPVLLLAEHVHMYNCAFIMDKRRHGVSGTKTERWRLWTRHYRDHYAEARRWDASMWACYAFKKTQRRGQPCRRSFSCSVTHRWSFLSRSLLPSFPGKTPAKRTSQLVRSSRLHLLPVRLPPHSVYRATDDRRNPLCLDECKSQQHNF